MSTYLFDIAWRILTELGVSKTGVATGGSTSTVIDTNGLKLVDNDYYNGGSLFVLKDAGGGGDAPENEFSEVTNFANETSTLTLLNALTTAVAAGDTYGVASPRFPLFRVIQKVNNILFMDGYIPGEDTSITTVASQTEYTLPAEASRDLRQVFWLSDNTNASKNDPIPVVNYRIKKTATGTADTLVLEYELPAGYTLWLRYAKEHAELRSASDELDQAIHPDRIVYQAASELLREYRDRTRLRNLDDTIQYLSAKSDRAKEMHPLPELPVRQSRITRVSRTLEIATRHYRSR